MEEVVEVMIALGPCVCMVSSMVSVVGSDYYYVSQSSAFVDGFLVRW